MYKEYWCNMFKIKQKRKNFLNCNELIIKGMYKRRRLAFASIARLSDRQSAIQIVK